jgi:hypothetical protein
MTSTPDHQPAADPGAPCPAAALAVEAAQTLRSWYALKPRAERQPAPPECIPYLGDSALGADGLTREYAARQLMARLKAIAAYAGHVPARSRKGALFQLYVAGDHLNCLGAGVVGALSVQASAALESVKAKAEGLFFHGLNALDGTDPDPDLRLLRTWFTDPAPLACLYGDHLPAQLANIAAQSAADSATDRQPAP